MRAFDFFTNRSIKQKQMLIIMLTSSVALLLASGGFLVYELRTFHEESTRNLSTLAWHIGYQNSGPIEFGDTNKAELNLKAVLASDKSIVAACVYTAKGEPFATYPPNSENKFTPPPWEEDGHHFGQNQLRLFRRVVLSNKETVPVYIESNLESLYARFKRYVGIILTVFALSFLSALLMSSRLQRVISEPILDLLHTARMISAARDYSVRAKKRAEDELGVLTDGFNAMLAQIQERDAALQKAHDELEKRVENRTLELQQQVTRISLLNQITHAVLDRQDMQSLIQVVLIQLESHLPADFGTVLLYDKKRDVLDVAAVSIKNQPDAAALKFLLKGKQINPDRLRLRECIAGKTVSEDGAPLDSHLLCQMSGLNFCALIATPLLVDNDTFGILVCARTSLPFSGGESEFLRVLSEQVALAANQAKLYSELQVAYNELRQTQQSIIEQERLRALGKMASGIAHDINNALSPVIVYADMLLRENPTLATQQKYLKHIKTAGEDIAHIVSRMREVYRKREQNEILSAINLNSLLQQVIDLTRPHWRDIPQERGVVVDVQPHFDPQIPEILGNQSELREAITNLVLNAVDAMPAGGKIFLKTSLRFWNSEASSERKATHVVLEVVDTGIGMDEETRSRCLEPFYTTKGQRGTGLGLAMVYGVTERHDAKIEIHSKLGKGTTFRVVFPVREINPTAPTVAADDEGCLPLRVLCIDDEPLLREMLKEILAIDGHDVEVADGGETGIEMFASALKEQRPFNIVITDLGMPYVDGRQVARSLKEQSPETPIIMLTGWGTMMKAESDFPAQVDAVLSKPPRLNELRLTLKCLTEKPNARFRSTRL